MLDGQVPKCEKTDHGIICPDGPHSFCLWKVLCKWTILAYLLISLDISTAQLLVNGLFMLVCRWRSSRYNVTSMDRMTIWRLPILDMPATLPLGGICGGILTTYLNHFNFFLWMWRSSDATEFLSDDWTSNPIDESPAPLWRKLFSFTCSLLFQPLHTACDHR